MSAIEEAVIQRIRERAEKGLSKYGVTLERTDLNLYDWLTHAQEECLDFLLYLECIAKAGHSDGALEMFVETHRNILLKASMDLEVFRANHEYLGSYSIG